MGLSRSKVPYEVTTSSATDVGTQAAAVQSRAVSSLDPATAALLDMVNPLTGEEQTPSARRPSLFDDVGPAPQEAAPESEPATKAQAVTPSEAGMVALADKPHAQQESPDEHPLAPVGVRLLSDEPLDNHDTEYQSIVRQKVLDLIREHGEETPDVEVCGVLVGTVYQNTDSGFVYIEDIIRGHGASGRNSAVTFTAETWSYIDKQMDEHHRGKRIVGWYHTHPGFGIFLSGMDTFIQDHFFNAPWQTALVYDPQSMQKGMFAWRDGKTVRVDFVVDDGTGPGGASRVQTAPVSEPGEGAHEDPVPAEPGSAGELSVKLDAIEKRQRHLLIALAVVAVVALVWPLVVLMVVPDLRHPGPSPSNEPETKPILPTMPEPAGGAQPGASGG